MTEPRIVVIGDSHVAPLRHALQSGLYSSRPVQVLRLGSILRNGNWIGDMNVDEAVAHVSALAPDDLLALALRGNDYNVIGLTQHPQPFDVLLPDRPQEVPIPGAEIIPYQVLRTFFQTILEAGQGELYERIAQASGAPVVCLEAPAPIEDEEHILRRADPFFVARGISDVGVTPAPTRLKLWQLQQEALASLCTRLGIRYAPCPPGTRDAKGYLQPAYYANDATHANAAYGALVLEQLQNMLLANAGRETELNCEAA